jgi:hypothetical protein
MRSWCRMRATAVLLMRNEWGVVAKLVAARDGRPSTSFDQRAELHRAMRRVVLGSSDGTSEKTPCTRRPFVYKSTIRKANQKVSSELLLVAIEFWFELIVLVLAGLQQGGMQGWSIFISLG